MTGCTSVKLRHGGFTLIACLCAVAVFSAMASVWVQRLSTEIQREREQELLKVGDQIAGAIASYRRASAGSARKYPIDLDELLDDRRAFGTIRHLRRVYPDPMSPNTAWGLVQAPDGGVMGVYSQQPGVPLMRTAVALRNTQLPPARQYRDWRFVPREAPP